MNYKEYTVDYCRSLTLSELKQRLSSLSNIYQGLLRAEGNMWWSEKQKRADCVEALDNLSSEIEIREDSKHE